MSETKKDDEVAAVKADPETDDPEALRREIADTRRKLGDTAAELAAKADVKGQVKERVEERREAVRDAGHRVQETAAVHVQRRDPRSAAIAGAIAALILLLVLRRRRR